MNLKTLLKISQVTPSQEVAQVASNAKQSQYLGKGAGDTLSKSELRKLRAKANKMKKSSKKEERDRGIQLARQVSFAFNMRN